MSNKDVAGVRATIDAWTFGEYPWSIEKFENLLDEDAMVIDDYGGELSLLHGHKDYRSVWGSLVNATMRHGQSKPRKTASRYGLMAISLLLLSFCAAAAFLPTVPRRSLGNFAHSRWNVATAAGSFSKSTSRPIRNTPPGVHHRPAAVIGYEMSLNCALTFDFDATFGEPAEMRQWHLLERVFSMGYSNLR